MGVGVVFSNEKNSSYANILGSTYFVSAFLWYNMQEKLLQESF